MQNQTSKFYIFIIILVLLSPIGLILPEVFKADCAWGEWGAEEFLGMIGYIPEGIEKFSGIWNAVLPDYNFPSKYSGNLLFDSISYILTGFIGVVSCYTLSLLVFKSGQVRGDN